MTRARCSVTDHINRPGQKEITARDKHRWIMACAIYRGFADVPGVVRLAILLFEYSNLEHGYAYPSRRTLAEKLGSPPESVSRWIGRLKDCRAIKVVKRTDLPIEVNEHIWKSSKRANYYLLNLEWAESVLEDVGDTEQEEAEAA